MLAAGAAVIATEAYLGHGAGAGRRLIAAAGIVTGLAVVVIALAGLRGPDR
jgi:hypothetical protein